MPRGPELTAFSGRQVVDNVPVAHGLTLRQFSDLRVEMNLPVLSA